MRGYWFRRLVPGVIASISLLITLGLYACSSAESFEGTVLTSENPATPFRLLNQFGQPVSLADHRGKAVLLTFLYTNCPAVCPLTTSRIRDAYEMLGDDAEDVAILAVSVDPERDTVEQARAFSEQWKMTHRWEFLVGDRNELAPIWKAYYVAASTDEGSGGNESNIIDESHGAEGGVDSLRRDIVSDYLVDHSAPVYLIDRDGLMRVLFTLPFEAEALAHDVRLLLD